MSTPPEDWPGLQLDEHFEAQKRGWTLDRIGWVVMLGIVGAALLGGFGNGPLGLASARGQELEVRYNRFGRLGADLVLEVRIDQAAASEGKFGLWVSSAYLQGVRIDQISPAPDAEEPFDEGILYTFVAGEGDLRAEFDLTGDRVGVLEGSVGSSGPQEAVSFSQFLYP
jgi:hypothetical protein